MIFLVLLLINNFNIYSDEFELSDEELEIVYKKVSSVLMYQYYLDHSLDDGFIYIKSKKNKDVYIDYFKNINSCLENVTINEYYETTKIHSFNNNFIIYNILPKYGSQKIVGFIDNSIRFIIDRNGRIYFLKGSKKNNSIFDSYEDIKHILKSENLILNAYYYLLLNTNVNILLELDKAKIFKKNEIELSKHIVDNNYEEKTSKIKFQLEDIYIYVYLKDGKFSHVINSNTK